MNKDVAQEILDKVVGTVFGYKNPLNLEQAMQKFAFDLRLPQQVYDSVDGSATWAISVNPSKFISLDNVRKYGETHISDGSFFQIARIFLLKQGSS